MKAGSRPGPRGQAGLVHARSTTAIRPHPARRLSSIHGGSGIEGIDDPLDVREGMLPERPQGEGDACPAPPLYRSPLAPPSW
jgi:hypothetical protein